MTSRSAQPPAAKAASPAFSVLIVNRQRRHAVRAEEIRDLLHRAAAAMKATGELAVVFASDPLLRQLNRDYRFQDQPTDVLSFESQGADMGLGDVIISVETARANAVRFSRTLDRELEILALHGFLHVLGFDHETDQGQMEALEKRLRARLLFSESPNRRPRNSGRTAGRMAA